MAPRTLRSIIVKPVGSFCNMHCDYCFYLGTQQLYAAPVSTHLMTEATLQKLFQEMFAGAPAPTFIWHGGEPTIAGLRFFRQVVAMQRFYAKGQPYFNALQTNGLLLNEEWAEFLRRENFLVGLSLDGPAQIHDAYRKDVQGKGTFERVFARLQMLVARGVPVNALVSVTDQAARAPREMYAFFVAHGVTFMQFSPVVERDPHNPAGAAAYSVTAKAYGSFLDQLFQLWVRDFDFKHLKQQTSIRFFDSLIRHYAGLAVGHCIFQKVCGDYLVVEHNGDLFSCDFLVAQDTYLGNLQSLSLQAAFESPAHVAFGQQKAAQGAICQQCRWQQLCEGGCIKDRLRDPRDHGHNHFCQSYKFFFKRAEPRLKKFARLYREYYLQQ